MSCCRTHTHTYSQRHTQTLSRSHDHKFGSVTRPNELVLITQATKLAATKDGYAGEEEREMKRSLCGSLVDRNLCALPRLQIVREQREREISDRPRRRRKKAEETTNR